MVLAPLPFFALLGFLVKGRQVFKDAYRALPESRTNVLIHFADVMVMMPVVALFTVAMQDAFDFYDLTLLPPEFWGGFHPWVVALFAVFLGDFVGYWRHRMEHTPLLWPSHAVHHSDTEMTWLAIFRFHPFNHLSTAILDYAFLLWLGLPAEAVLVNSLVRHFYGAFIHADLPWTFGPLGKVIVSPAMHRWHHSIDRDAYNTNYAVVFSIFDRMFGTYRVPGVCTTKLGVPETIGSGAVSMWLHPLKPSSYRYFARSVRRLIRRSA